MTKELNPENDHAEKPDLDLPPTKENPGFTGSPEDLLNKTVRVKGGKSGVVTARVLRNGKLHVVIDGKEYEAGDLIEVQSEH